MGDAVSIIAPADSGEVQKLFASATQTGIPVYTYRDAKRGGTQLDLSKLSKILEIDEANLVAVAEPGVKLSVLAAALAKVGLRFIPADTPFYHDKTLGQMVYEGLANISSSKYGFTKHFIMGTEFVLPTGELLRTGGKTVKNVTGYDVTRFLSGPYNDLGVAVSYTLKLLPLPEARKGVAAAFNDYQQVFNFAKALRQERIIPSYMMWIDEATRQLACSNGAKGSLVLLELDGVREEVAEQWEIVSHLIEKHGGKAEEIADGQLKEAEKWRCLFGPIDALMLTDELKFPFAAQAGFVAHAYGLVGKEVRIGLSGPIGDGRLNVAIGGMAAAKKRHETARKLIDDAVMLGGFSSGKYSRLHGEAPQGLLQDLEKELKKILDPALVINR